MRVTKRQLSERVRGILHSTRDGAEVCGANRDFLLALLEHHPDLAEWPVSEQGAVTRITRARSGLSQYHTPCLYLHYENGETWEVSDYKCIRNMTTAQVKNFTVAYENEELETPG